MWSDEILAILRFLSKFTPGDVALAKSLSRYDFKQERFPARFIHPTNATLCRITRLKNKVPEMFPHDKRPRVILFSEFEPEMRNI